MRDDISQSWLLIIAYTICGFNFILILILTWLNVRSMKYIQKKIGGGMKFVNRYIYAHAFFLNLSVLAVCLYFVNNEVASDV